MRIEERIGKLFGNGRMIVRRSRDRAFVVVRSWAVCVWRGVPLIEELARYWTTDYDWHACEARLNALPQDAFDLVLPSLPGYGFSGEPAEVGWDPGRVARAWAELRSRRPARGPSHPGQDRRQHHAVLADGDPGPRRPGSTGRADDPRPALPARLRRKSRCRSASRRSPARSSGPRAAGSSRRTPASPTSTRSTRAAISPPGRSPSCSRPRSGRPSGRSARGKTRADERRLPYPLHRQSTASARQRLA